MQLREKVQDIIVGAISGRETKLTLPNILFPNAQEVNALAKTINNPNCKLFSIDFFAKQIGNKGAETIALALQAPNCGLKSVKLSFNEIGDEGAEAIALAFKNPNCQIDFLILSWNNISNKGAVAIADALKHPNCKIEHIDLDNNKIGNEGAIAIAEALKHPNCKIKYISLQNNKIEANGVRALREAGWSLGGKINNNITNFEFNYFSEHRNKLLAGVALCAFVAVCYTKPEILTNISDLFSKLFNNISNYVMGK